MKIDYQQEIKYTLINNFNLTEVTFAITCDRGLTLHVTHQLVDWEVIGSSLNLNTATNLTTLKLVATAALSDARYK